MKSNHEKAFRSAYPKATIEGFRTHGGEHCFVVRKTAKSTPISGAGSTRIAAWREAASSIALAKIQQ